MNPQFSRTEMLIGKGALKVLASSRIAVFGMGGVGSYTVEALARSGVGAFLLVDNDVVSVSNCNRQLHAALDTVGQYKTGLMKARILAVNPGAEVLTREEFCLPENVSGLLEGDFDYIVDAIDTVSAKIGIIEEAGKRVIPVISSMGTGNKLDPARFEVADIYDTSVCPLCRVMRRELKKRGIPALKVVYSKEPPIEVEHIDDGQKRHVPGSISFVPPVAGMIIAAEVVKDLIQLTMYN